MATRVPHSHHHHAVQDLFQQRRAEHKAAVETILHFPDSAKQHKMVNIIAAKAFEVLEQSQVKLREAGYIPGMDFPRTSMYEMNTAFLGEILLHLPDLTHQLLRRNKPWQLLLTWGVFFATQSKFLDQNTGSFIYLVSQELGVAERDPHFTNPYWRHPSKNPAGASQPPLSTPGGGKAKKKKTFKKGPMLSRKFGDL
ncbi:Coiled-coil domain-containing protein 134 [Chionoecetes opilio]|uniref:Coiled-coil domain-containing protein 134 n=1 Tax=Chionoecetes opilio TaxID=41210 RepID=A0A8J5D1T7_CHIOP|nr:Coiled-coil domain-containing protein 134 [Chionoecetes opilio]